MRHVDPPFLLTRFVADLRSDEEVLWSDVKVDADAEIARMDSACASTTFAFEYRGGALAWSMPTRLLNRLFVVAGVTNQRMRGLRALPHPEKGSRAVPLTRHGLPQLP